MIGYCSDCGCAIYTRDDVGLDDIVMQNFSIGVLPRIKRYSMPVRHLVCHACIDERAEDMKDWLESGRARIEAAFNEWVSHQLETNGRPPVIMHQEKGEP